MNSTTLLKLLNCSYRLAWFQLNLGGVKGGSWPLCLVVSLSPGIVIYLKCDENQLNAMSTSWFTIADRRTHGQLPVPTLTNMQLNE